MATGYQAKHRAEQALGKAKRKVGKVTDDQSLRAKGTVQEAKAGAKRAADEAAARVRAARSRKPQQRDRDQAKERRSGSQV